MLSRILGFARDVMLAAVLGAGPIADAFFVAFKLPNFFRRMLAEGTLGAAVVPVLTEARSKSEQQARDYLNRLTTLLIAFLLLLTTAGLFAMPLLLALFAPGLVQDAERWPVALSLARWMFPYLFLITLAALAWAVLNAYRRFALPAASPALLNLSLLFFGLVVAPVIGDPGLALAWGVLAGGLMQLAAQLPALRAVGWCYRIRWPRFDSHLRQTLRLFLPALASIAAVQLNVLVGTILATFLPTGAISELYYADRLVQLPLALFGIAMGTALLPELSKLAQQRKQEPMRAVIDEGLAWLSWITLPAAAGLAYLATPLIEALFERGRFDAAAATGAGAALAAYAVGLVGFCWTKVLAAACYAQKDAKAPMRYALIGVGANLIASIALMRPLGVAGLALATSIAGWINALLLYRRLRQGRALLSQAQAKRIVRAILACMAMLGILSLWTKLVSFPEKDALRLAWCAGAVILGLASFLLAARLLGERISLRRRA